MPSILREGAAHGARCAGYTMLRLPGPVKDLFLDWLRRELPDRAGKIVSRIKDIREGRMNDSRWSVRMKGKGEFAKTIRELFVLNCRKCGLNKGEPQLSTDNFVRETKRQLDMFR